MSFEIFQLIPPPLLYFVLFFFFVFFLFVFLLFCFVLGVLMLERSALSIKEHQDVLLLEWKRIIMLGCLWHSSPKNYQCEGVYSRFIFHTSLFQTVCFLSLSRLHFTYCLSFFLSFSLLGYLSFSNNGGLCGREW